MKQFKTFVGSKAELEKIARNQHIAWRGIIGLAKFDEGGENLYINRDEATVEKPEINLAAISLLIQTKTKTRRDDPELQEFLKDLSGRL